MSLGDYAKLAANRAKQEIKQQIKKRLVPILLKYGLPVLAIIVVFIAIIAAVSGDGEEASAAENDTSGYTEIGGDNWEIFKEWVHALEGVSASADGDYYIVYLDSEEIPTVGYGVNLQAHPIDGYSATVGTQIPVDIVDAKEDEIINGKKSILDTEVSDINLKEYQYYALLSRVYNKRFITN